jgi:ferredoxin
MIVASLCTACGACEFECPNSAISMAADVYAIDPSKCQECKGEYDTPQCAKVCPIPDTCVPMTLLRETASSS